MVNLFRRHLDQKKQEEYANDVIRLKRHSLQKEADTTDDIKRHSGGNGSVKRIGSFEYIFLNKAQYSQIS